MSDPSEPLKIMGWNLEISWTDGRVETITDLPDDIAQALDDYLTDLETEQAHEHAMKHADKYINKTGV